MAIPPKPSISVVIPVYNSAGCLAIAVESIHRELGEIASQFEIILINDGSVDASWNSILLLCDKYPSVRGI
uniref:glycosyltransferase n=1 Tax=Klebsiella pneumoniae TaxID=573 RepID=UPI003B97D543